MALSCSGLPSASCELDPPSVRVAPERAGSSTLKISYSEGMPFGVFDATATEYRWRRIDNRDDDR